MVPVNSHVHIAVFLFFRDVVSALLRQRRVLANIDILHTIQPAVQNCKHRLFCRQPPNLNLSPFSN